MTLKKVATVNLMGGLGNQLHQIVFSKYLQDHGYKVKIDLSWFNIPKFSDGTTKRNLEVDVSNFGLEALDEKRKIIDSEKFINKNSKIVNKLYHSNINFLYKEHFGNDYNDDKYYLINKFNGYWQNSKYIHDSKNFLFDGLRKHNSFRNFTKNDKTMIHIRKGDFVNWGEDLPLNYYKNSLLSLKEYKNEIKYDIYTDLKKLNNLDSLFKDANKIYNNSNDSGMKVLSKMLSYKNFIISNSSLSFFSAYLGSTDNSKIFYPHPWFKSIKHKPYTENNWSPIEY